jgi:hypothetical protein
MPQILGFFSCKFATSGVFASPLHDFGSVFLGKLCFYRDSTVERKPLKVSYGPSVATSGTGQYGPCCAAVLAMVTRLVESMSQLAGF